MRVPLAGSTLVKVPGSGHSDEHAAVAAGPVRRDVAPATTRPSAPGSRRVTRWRSSATAPSACAPSSPPGGSAPSASSRSAATPTGSRSPVSSAPPTSSRSAATKPPQAVLELTGGIGVDAALECVGTGQSIDTALAIARPGSTDRHRRCPARRRAVRPRRSSATRRLAGRRRPRPASTSPSCSATSSTGRINPGRVFDYETDLDHIADAYAAMDERRAIKSLIRVGAV